MHLVQLEFAVTAEVILVIAFTWVGIWRIINQQFLVIANLVGNKISAEKHLNKCLFIVGIGSNDYINNYLLPEIYPSSHLYAPSQYATALIDQYSRHLRSRNVVSDNYAIQKKSFTEEKPVTSKWIGKISRDSYLIPFQWLNP
uniref:Uncharacterized protein n=1 Tax=Solanum lycopersicum TaxID=4081 RepID=K4B8E4_SOLLC